MLARSHFRLLLVAPFVAAASILLYYAAASVLLYYVCYSLLVFLMKRNEKKDFLLSRTLLAIIAKSQTKSKTGALLDREKETHVS